MTSLLLTRKQRSLPAWIFSIIIGLVLLYTLSALHGVPKLLQEEQVTLYFVETLGFGIPLLLASGLAETLGPLLLLHWRTSFYGSLLIFVNCVVALSVVISSGGFSYELLAYLLLSLVIAYWMRPGFLRRKPRITTVTI